MRVRSKSPSVYSISSDEESDFAPSSPDDKPSAKRKRTSTSASTKGKPKPVTAKRKVPAPEKAGEVGDIEDAGNVIPRRHGMEYHDVHDIVGGQRDLLDWFEGVREKRGMPWRKRYNHDLSMEEKGQRAYEVLSEVMLQQTQVTTVIAYWEKWVAKWPTIADLAKADIEEVNAAWRGLGYYRRAKSLLTGAQTVMSDPKYQGRLPDDPAVLEKDIAGVGRYTAGAICSMAYGVRTPIVDGNIHRLLTRLLAIHAPQAAPQTIKHLWAAATELVSLLPSETEGVAGDWNQGLMELGSQVCKPVSPECGGCPVKAVCKASAEVDVIHICITACQLTSEQLKAPPPLPSTSSECSLCHPIPQEKAESQISSVAVFPMKKEKKASRVEEEDVCVLEWRGQQGKRRWLFVKRPDKGLLAGLFEPPTTPVSAGLSAPERLHASIITLSNYLNVSELPNLLDDMKEGAKEKGSVAHIFSHINMTYHIHLLTLPSSSSSEPPDILRTAPRQAFWLSEEEVESANVGTGVKKVWAEVYGRWGSFEESSSGAAGAGKGKKVVKKQKTTAAPKGKGRWQKVAKSALSDEEGENGKVVKKVMMPMMPAKRKAARAEEE
ncbi:A/G-specific adenine glycosylase [Cryptococcus amylolentus CBS 6273]|uniref:Adenine DNA glycosylase n=1 Tax=Cryptococcus amylolentus CBS 6273 TaxID=1296118 RepID=A0A1E3K4R1_9TREE|nr:A/G-specific adenine glycosylase [Cryptococcus amylolentus CBS 6273]